MNDQMPVGTEEPQKKNNTIIIVVAIVVLCCCCLALIPAGRWLWDNGDNLVSISTFLQVM